MLVSLFTSFLLARIFRRKLYVLFMGVGLLLISFFSVGVPEYVSVQKNGFQLADTEGLLLNNPPPLSLPFYSSTYHRTRTPGWIRDSEWEGYRLSFATTILQGTRIYYKKGFGSVVLTFSWLDYIIYSSFFLLINIIGAVLGYWIGRRRWLAAGVLIGILILASLILLYDPISLTWKPPDPEVTTVQGHCSQQETETVFIVDVTVKNNGGEGWVKVYVVTSGFERVLERKTWHRIYFARGENKTLSFTFEEGGPSVTYRAWAEVD